MNQTINCIHCGTPLGRLAKGGRMKIYVRSRCLVIRPDTGVEINCHHCKKSTDLPLTVSKSLTTNEHTNSVARETYQGCGYNSCIPAPFCLVRMTTETPFKLWAAFDVIEKSDENATRRGRIKGIASSECVDADAEIVVQSGLDWDYFLKKGFISLEHPLGITNIVGEPVSVESCTIGGEPATRIEADLLLDDPMANQIYTKAKVLKKANSSRKLGFSIEGRTLSRSGNIIEKAMVTSVAISAVPKNPYTYFEPLMASMLYRAFAGIPAHAVPNVGEFNQLMLQSMQGVDFGVGHNTVDKEGKLIAALLRKLPMMTWEQGKDAIENFLNSPSGK